MHSQLTYGDLDATLCRLGLARVSTEGPQRLYEQPDDENAASLLPPTAADAPVRPHHLAMVRTSLDLHGIIDRDDFDRLLAGRDVATA